MFGKLKEQAAAAAKAAAEGAQKLAADTKDRIDTVSAGKKLLDEGGEGMKQKLLAKHASQTATQIDTAFLFHLGKVCDNYKEANVKMQAAGGLPGGEAETFKELGQKYVKRSNELELASSQVKSEPGTQATISPIEADAILILTSKMQAQGLHDKIRSSFSTGAGSEAVAENSNEVVGIGEEPESKKGWMDLAKETAAGAPDRAKERLENAKAGKKMVDEGGPDAVTKLLAKKASLDTTASDAFVIKKLEKAVAAYKEAEAKTKEALPQDGGNEAPSFTALAAYFSTRAADLEALLKSLSPVPEAINTPESERDGIRYVVAQQALNTASETASTAAADLKADVQVKMVEQGLSSAVSGATGGAVTKVPEGTGKAAVQYAKENPEQAKAAMQFAADAAAASKDKGAGSGGGYS